MHIEFTKLPDPERDRKNVRAHMIRLLRRRLWISGATALLACVIGVGIMLTGDRPFGAYLLVFGVVYLALLAWSVTAATKRAYRRIAKVSSVPVLITITDIDVTFARPWNYVSWAWAGIDSVTDFGFALVGRCGGAAAFTIPLEPMPPERVPELRSFLHQHGLLVRRRPTNAKIGSTGAIPM
jgi:hypothetical protein